MAIIVTCTNNCAAWLNDCMTMTVWLHDWMTMTAWLWLTECDYDCIEWLYDCTTEWLHDYDCMTALNDCMTALNGCMTEWLWLLDCMTVPRCDVSCSVDRAYRYNPVKKNQLDAQLILSIFCQPLHASGVSVPIIRRYKRMSTTCGTVCCAGWIVIQDNRQSSKRNDKYQMLYTYGCTSWWWPEAGRGWRNILRISCASSWVFFTWRTVIFW